MMKISHITTVVNFMISHNGHDESPKCAVSETSYVFSPTSWLKILTHVGVGALFGMKHVGY